MVRLRVMILRQIEEMRVGSVIMDTHDRSLLLEKEAMGEISSPNRSTATLLVILEFRAAS